MTASKKVSSLPDISTVTSNTIIYVIDTSNEPYISKKVNFGTLVSSIKDINPTTSNANTSSANTVVARDFLFIPKKATVTNSAMEISEKQIFFDNNYLYVTTANNVVKRIPLQSF